MEWSFQKLFTMPREMQIPWLTYQQFSNLIGNLTDMIIEEQNWQPMIDEIWKNRQLKDYSERKSSYKSVIYYRFVGYLEIPLTESEWEYYQANTRQGVAVEYISKNIPA